MKLWSISTELNICSFYESKSVISCFCLLMLTAVIWVILFVSQLLFSCQVVSNSVTPMACSPPGSSVHGIFHARILEWVVISFSRGSSRPRIKPASPVRQADSLFASPGKPLWIDYLILIGLSPLGLTYLLNPMWLFFPWTFEFSPFGYLDCCSYELFLLISSCPISLSSYHTYIYLIFIYLATWGLSCGMWALLAAPCGI